MHRHQQLIQVEDYAELIGEQAVKRIRGKAEPLKGIHVVHVNSTHYGGGVAKLLDSLTLLMSGVGIKTGWRTIQGAPDFFSITKKMGCAAFDAVTDFLNPSPSRGACLALSIVL